MRLWVIPALAAAVGALAPNSLGVEPPRAVTTAKTPKASAYHNPALLLRAGHTKETARKKWHPPHRVKVWMARHKGRTFRIIQLPRCEHLETLITYDPSGETLAHAKARLGGIAACTGSFHNSRSMALADFLQRKGAVLSPAVTGRDFVVIRTDGSLDISGNYPAVKRKLGVSALALGQRLVPLHKDGFSTAFMNKQTDRMAIGLNNNFIFIVQGKSDIWRLADFMQRKLPVRIAVNSDGGHVVRGRAPVHIVFRWRNGGASKVLVAASGKSTDKQGG